MLIIAVWTFGSTCLALLAGVMDVSTANAISIHQEEVGCGDGKNIDSQLQCCVNRSQSQDGAVNLIQTQPLMMSAQIVKATHCWENNITIIKHSFRTLNTSAPPKNLPGVIVKKE